MPPMPKASCNGIEIEYELRGADGAGADKRPTLLFIMGLGAQMIGWDEDFLDGFVARGYRVLRFDNRDIGLSTRLPTESIGALMQAAMATMGGDRSQPVPYELTDMAEDSAALLDALGIKQAHVIGASMGGMIAQLLAIRHPHRVLSLTSLMSTNAEPGLPPPRPHAMGALLSPLGKDPEAIVAGLLNVFRTIGSPAPLFDEERIRDRVRRAYERSFHPPGMIRQFLAVLRARSRKERLAALTVPALVVHGEEDPLVPVECGRATAAAIPGARLLTFPGMGHDLPMALWPQLTDAICEVIERGEQKSQRAS